MPKRELPSAASDWKPIGTLPEFLDCPDHILLWNPCDGPHLIWATFEGPNKLDKIRAGDMYTAWCVCPEPQGQLRKFIERKSEAAE